MISFAKVIKCCRLFSRIKEMEKTLDVYYFYYYENNVFYKGNLSSLQDCCSGAIKQLPDSGYIICGYVIDSISDKLLFKTDKTGRVEWSKTYNSTRYENLSCIEVTPDGGFIFSGINGDQTSLWVKRVYVDQSFDIFFRTRCWTNV